TKITDSGLDHLKDLTNLQFLYLRNTQITDKAIKDLLEELPKLNYISFKGKFYFREEFQNYCDSLSNDNANTHNGHTNSEQYISTPECMPNAQKSSDDNGECNVKNQHCSHNSNTRDVHKESRNNQVVIITSCVIGAVLGAAIAAYFTVGVLPILATIGICVAAGILGAATAYLASKIFGSNEVNTDLQDVRCKNHSQHEGIS
uniref:hypothetical protein n=1 Tax=Wolbachia endosymbiont of Pentidionis agamae TaxID=3110435 RepID=UPI002FCEC9ED